MTEAVSHSTEKPLFTVAEIEQFDADDVVAGKAIGKMLSLLFLYTVFVMALVSWWTFRSVRDRASQAQTNSSAAESAPSESAAHH